MKIDLLIAENPYATTPHFTKALARGLEELGVQTRLFWIGEGNFFHAFYAISEDPPDFTCSFSSISLNGLPLGALWPIPHLSLLVDPPLYSLHQLKGERSWISCVDEKDVAFVKKLGKKEVFFLPHAADASVFTPVNSPRPFRYVFFGSCLDLEALEAGWPAEKQEEIEEATRLVLSPSGLSIDEALTSLGIKEDDFAACFTAVDAYVRGKDRIELIRSFEGDEIHVWGEGPWQKYAPSAHLHPPVSFSEAILLMQQSQVVLNSSPRFKAGAHERIFYALLCGANVYTGKSSYLSEILPDLTTYTYGLWEQQAPSFDQELAYEGQSTVLKKHTFSNRAQRLLTHLISD